MVGITQPRPGEHVNANGVWDLLQNKGKMTVFSLCLLLCADLLDLAVGKCDPVISFSHISEPLAHIRAWGLAITVNEFRDSYQCNTNWPLTGQPDGGDRCHNRLMPTFPLRANQVVEERNQ